MNDTGIEDWAERCLVTWPKLQSNYESARIKAKEQKNQAGISDSVIHALLVGGYKMDVEKERMAFEKWFSSDNQKCRSIERSGESYKLIQAASAWIAWQACAIHHSSKGG